MARLSGEGIGGVVVPYRSTYYDWDDFASYSGGANQIGRLGWFVGGGTTTTPASTAGRIGVVRRDTGSSINTIARLTFNINTSSSLMHTDNLFDVTWVVKLNQTDADFTCRIGFDTNNFASNPDANGIYFERLGGGSADANWFGVTRSGSTQSRVDTGAAVSTDWVTLRLRRVSSSAVGFSVNGGTEVTSSSNVPSASAQFGLHLINLAGASKTIDVDFVSMLVTGLSR